jgi:hypothetical protein
MFDMHAEPMNPQPDNLDELIDLTRSFDRAYWKHRLHVSEETLAFAVADVGPRLGDVMRHLGLGGANSSASAILPAA